jgi:hypothetical protein
MKINLLLKFAASASVIVFSACASSGSALVLEPVGPPVAPAATAAFGTLVVFSAYSVHAPALGEPDNRQRYTDYRIFSPTGQLLRTIVNDAGLAVAAPVPVNLPPGSYEVVARANGYGVIKVPVVVAEGQATTLHLEGGGFAPAGAGEVVRLPDGQVVGWRAGR